MIEENLKSEVDLLCCVIFVLTNQRRVWSHEHESVFTLAVNSHVNLRVNCFQLYTSHCFEPRNSVNGWRKVLLHSYLIMFHCLVLLLLFCFICESVILCRNCLLFDICSELRSPKALKCVFWNEDSWLISQVQVQLCVWSKFLNSTNGSSFGGRKQSLRAENRLSVYRTSVWWIENIKKLSMGKISNRQQRLTWQGRGLCPKVGFIYGRCSTIDIKIQRWIHIFELSGSPNTKPSNWANKVAHQASHFSNCPSGSRLD